MVFYVLTKEDSGFKKKEKKIRKFMNLIKQNSVRRELEIL